MRKGPTVLQAFLITVSGGALAFFGCIGALVGTNFGTGRTDTVGTIGIVVFIIGAVVFAGGGLILTFYIVRAIWQSLTRKKPVSPPPGA